MKKKKQPPKTITPEWPHKVETARIGAEPYAVKLTTTEQQRKDMARRAGIDAIGFLEAQMTLKRNHGNGLIHVKGVLNADVTQDCAVTLKSLQSKVTDSFEAWYTDHDAVVSLAGVRRERDSMLSDGELPVAEEHEDPESAVDGVIDVGELAAQYFCLAVSLYPRAEDSNYENSVDTGLSALPSRRQNPFAALKDWKSGKGREK